MTNESFIKFFLSGILAPLFKNHKKIKNALYAKETQTNDKMKVNKLHIKIKVHYLIIDSSISEESQEPINGNFSEYIFENNPAQLQHTHYHKKKITLLVVHNLLLIVHNCY